MGFFSYSGSSIGGPPVPAAGQILDQWGKIQNLDANGIPTFTGDHKAAKLRSWIAREEWNDYKQRFAPREEAMISQATGEGAINELNRQLMGVAITNHRNFTAATDSRESVMQRYGVQNDQAIQQSFDQTNQAQQSLALVDGFNRTRQHMTDRNMNLMGGSSTRTAIMES